MASESLLARVDRTEIPLFARLDRTGIPLLVGRLFTGGFFAYLSYMKLIDLPGFLKQLHEYNFFPAQPPELVNTIAITVPCLEMVCAICLIFGVFLRGAATVIIGMLLFFYPLLISRALGLLHTPALGFASFCDVKFDCGCGTGVVYICPKLAENTAQLVGALIVLFSRSRRWTLTRVVCGGRTTRNATAA